MFTHTQNSLLISLGTVYAHTLYCTGDKEERGVFFFSVLFLHVASVILSSLSLPCFCLYSQSELNSFSSPPLQLLSMLINAAYKPGRVLKELQELEDASWDCQEETLKAK